jgi:hypothetical protein
VSLIEIYALWGMFPAIVCVGIIWGWAKIYDINVYSFLKLKTYLDFFPVFGLLTFIIILVYKLGPGSR